MRNRLVRSRCPMLQVLWLDISTAVASIFRNPSSRRMNFWTGPARFRLCLFVFLYLSFSARAAVLESCDEPSLRAAIGNGGRITFACDGTIYPSQTLLISTDTIIDGIGHQIVINGGGEVQI